MSEAHPDADLVKVTRTITTYEPAATGPVAVRRRNRTLIWVVGVILVVAMVAGGLIWLDLSSTPAAVQQGAVAADQGRAQTLTQQAASAQQSADQSATQNDALAATAAQDRTAARHAAAIATAAGRAP